MKIINNTPHSNMLKYWLKKNGFTLVELIIVITILGILATISFISFKNYSWNARDGNRVSTLKNIETGLWVYFVKTWEYPMPEWNILTGSINGKEIIYSWEIGENISRSIKLNKVSVDPVLWKNYKYWITYNKQEYNLWGIGESDSISQKIIPITYADNYFWQVVGNYRGYIKYSTGSYHYLTNPPSLIFTYSGSVNNVEDIFLEKEKVHFIIKKWENIPYEVSGKINSQNPDEVIKKKTGKPNAHFENLDISEVVSASSDTEKKTKIQELLNNQENEHILDSFWSDNEEMFENIVNGWIPQTTSNNSSSSSSSSWWGNLPSQNNCLANPSFEKDWKIFNVPELTNWSSANPKPYIDVVENNGTFRYELTVNCNDGSLDGSVSSPILQSCNSSFHNESGICISDTKSVSCWWTNPWVIVSILWTATTNITWNANTWPSNPNWTHSTTTPWACQYQCKAWYYFNGTSCLLSDIWYYVNTPWSIVQTQCPSWQITSQKWSTNINQCYIPKFTQICNTLSSSDYYKTIIYTNVSWLEIWRVDYNWNPINWNPWSLPIDGHIVVCGENISDRFVLKAMNQWAYWIWGYETLWATSHPSYWNYYIFWNGELESWWVSKDVAETITWESSTSEGKEQMQGPCEPGYHVPTYYEWRSIVLLMSGANVSNSLKLPFPGIRYQNDANVIFQWQLAYYWTSSPDSSWGGAHYVSPSSNWQLFSWGHDPNTSISVRCFKNDSF